jgi:histidyl-tRNA synthetase
MCWCADGRQRAGSSAGLSQRLRAAGSTSKPRWSRASWRSSSSTPTRRHPLRGDGGEDEAARGVVAVKDLRRGEQFEVPRRTGAHLLVSANRRAALARAGERRMA